MTHRKKYHYGWADPRSLSPWGLRWSHYGRRLKAIGLFLVFYFSCVMLWELMT